MLRADEGVLVLGCHYSAQAQSVWRVFGNVLRRRVSFLCLTLNRQKALHPRAAFDRSDRLATLRAFDHGVEIIV